MGFPLLAVPLAQTQRVLLVPCFSFLPSLISERESLFNHLRVRKRVAFKSQGSSQN